MRPTYEEAKPIAIPKKTTEEIVSATATSVISITTTEYLPYTTTSFDVLGATGTLVTQSVYTYTTTISKGVPITTTVTTTIGQHPY